MNVVYNYDVLSLLAPAGALSMGTAGALATICAVPRYYYSYY